MNHIRYTGSRQWKVGKTGTAGNSWIVTDLRIARRKNTLKRPAGNWRTRLVTTGDSAASARIASYLSSKQIVRFFLTNKRSRLCKRRLTVLLQLSWNSLKTWRACFSGIIYVSFLPHNPLLKIIRQVLTAGDADRRCCCHAGAEKQNCRLLVHKT